MDDTEAIIFYGITSTGIWVPVLVESDGKIVVTE